LGGGFSSLRELKHVKKLMQIIRKDAKYDQPPPIFGRNPFTSVDIHPFGQSEPSMPVRRKSSSLS